MYVIPQNRTNNQNMKKFYNPISGRTINISKNDYDKFLTLNKLDKLRNFDHNLRDDQNDQNVQNILKNKITYFPFLIKNKVEFRDFYVIYNPKTKKYGVICFTKVENLCGPTFIQIPLINYKIDDCDNCNKNYRTDAKFAVYNHLLGSYKFLGEKSFLMYVDKNEKLANIYSDRRRYKILRKNEWLKFTNKTNNNYKILNLYFENLIDFYPFQSNKMREWGDIRLGKKEDIMKYLENKKWMEDNVISDNSKLLNQPSEIDIFKMKRKDDKINYKYIFQLDDNIKNMHNNLNIAINNKKLELAGINNIFIPFATDLSGQLILSDIKYLEQLRMHIVGEKRFVEKIKSETKDKKLVGKLLFELNKSFEMYKDYEKTDKYDSSKKRAWGLTKNEINEYLKKFRDESLKLHEMTQNMKNDINKIGKGCEELFKLMTQDCEITRELLELHLANGESVAIPDKYDKIRKICWEEKYDFGKLSENIKGNDDKLFNTCHQYSFSNLDLFDGRTTECEKIYVSDPKIKNNLEKLGIKTASDENSATIEANFDFMPEWKKAIIDEKYEEGWKNRQLILGDLAKTKLFRECSFMMRGSPWYGIIYLGTLSWTIDLNKTVIACLLNSNLIFPVRLELNDIEEQITMYQHIFDKFGPDELVFLGTQLVKYAQKYISLYYFYNKKFNSITIYNYRGNRVFAGHVSDYIRILFIEFNILYYANDDLGLNTKLKYYRLEGTNTIYVSKYNIEEIKHKYFDLGIPDHENIISRLEQYELIKDGDKKFFFSKIIDFTGSLFGGGIDNNYHLFLEENKWKWDIKYSKNKDIFSPGFPQDMYSKYINLFQKLAKKMGPRFFVYREFINPLQLQTLQHHKKNLNPIFSKNIPGYKNERENPNKNYSGTIENILKKSKFRNILKYQFTYVVSITYFDAIHSLSLIKKNVEDKTIIFSRNIFAIESITYYKKYKLFDFDPDNILQFLWKYDEKLDGGVGKEFLKRENIKWINIAEPINNNNLEKISKNMFEKIDLAFIDCNIVISPELFSIRGAYDFQFVLSCLTISLGKLKRGGNLILFVSQFSNRMMFDFFRGLGTFFKKKLIFDYRNNPHLHYDLLVFKKYNGQFDIAKLREINKKMYECDPSGGYNFDITDNEAKKRLNINYKSKNPAKCYLTKIVDIDPTDSINTINTIDQYKIYCQKMEKIYRQKIDFLEEINYMWSNPNSIHKKIKSNMLYSVKYLSSIGLPIVDWFDENGYDEHFYDKNIRKLYFDRKPKKRQIQHTCSKINISCENKINNFDTDYLVDIWKSGDSIYDYIDTTNRKAWKSIELYINNRQKRLSNFLKDSYGINSMDKKVSRAWIKMVEIINGTNYYDNLISQKTRNVKSFHICEAPGNFILANEWFLKTKNIKYNWNAQSLVSGDFFDEYGLIKSNKSKWDFGIDKTGNITNYKNLKYYYDKYKGVDSLIGDCGIKWTSKRKGIKNLTIYQLLYCLLIPREGGNFILKSPNVSFKENRQIISLIYLASCKYDKLYMFRSSRNIWSPEAYIVGINKKEISQKEINNLLQIAEGLEQNKIIYPIKNMSHSFLVEFEYYSQEFVNSYVDIKKIFVYLARHPDDFEKTKKYIDKYINIKNVEWMRENIGNLINIEDCENKYTNYVNKNNQDNKDNRDIEPKLIK